MRLVIKGGEWLKLSWIFEKGDGFGVEGKKGNSTNQIDMVWFPDLERYTRNLPRRKLLRETGNKVVCKSKGIKQGKEVGRLLLSLEVRRTIQALGSGTKRESRS